MSWKIDPFSKEKDAFQISWTHLQPYAPPLQFDRSGVEESTSGSSKFNSNNTGLADTSLVPKSTANVNKETYFNTKLSETVSKPDGGRTPVSVKQKLKTCGLDSFRGRLESKGISENAAYLITAARRRGTYAHYESSWRKWTSWCATKQIDPFRCSINFILDFLAHAFREGFQYSTIAGYRSAISAYHDPIDNEPVGKHHRVSALLAGIHNERFPQPKNNFIWDVEVVVKFLASISEEQLSDKLLTLKLTMLMSLASAARAHEICFLDTQFLVKHHSMYSFALGKPTKTSKPEKVRLPIVFKKSSDKSWCVCHNID